MQVKSNVAEIIVETNISFKDGIHGQSWLQWFRARHPQLVLRVPQALDHKSARVVKLWLNSTII